jgi:hypothetical protein
MIQNELAAALDPNARPPLIPRGFCFLIRASETLERKARATPVRPRAGQSIGEGHF